MPDAPSQEVGFAQQGAVDWVAFAKSTPQFTIDVLARIQGAGVQPITYAAGLQLTTRFKLSERGLQRLDDAIKKLRVYSSASELLYFGFGHRSFFRILTETVQGLKLIALCSCLAEAHSTAMAAKILSALWKEYEFSEDFEPSHQQFEAIVKVCSGVLAASPFAEVQRRMTDPTTSPGAQQCCEPADVAKALHGLFDITLNSKKRIAVSGGASCAFIAAVSYWLFNLDTYVEDSNEEIVFASSVGNRPIDPMSTEVYVKYGAPLTSLGLEVTEASYVLGSIRDLILLENPGTLRFRTRVPWDVCLSYVFGQRFTELMESQETLGSILGSVARVKLALAEGQHDVCGFDRRFFLDFTDASYGHGFLASVVRTFPELSTPELSQSMANAISGTCRDACDILDASFVTLKAACGCRNCNKYQKSSIGLKSWCCVALAATLISVVSIVSAVEVETEMSLHPAAAGLQALYASKLRKMTRVATHEARHFFLEWTCDESGPFNPYDPWRVSLQQTLKLFTGFNLDSRKPRPSEGEDFVSVCAEGICVFPEALVCMTTHAERLRRIHIIPGHIAKVGSRSCSTVKYYDKISDVSRSEPKLNPLEVVHRPVQDTVVSDAVHLSSSRELHMCKRKTTDNLLSNSIQARPGGPDPRFSVTPQVLESMRTGELAFFYQVSGADGDIIIRPGHLTKCVLWSTGLAGCDNVHCSPVRSEDMPRFTIQQGWSMDDKTVDQIQQVTSGDAYCDWSISGLTDLERLVAYSSLDEDSNLQCMDGRHGTYSELLLRRSECLSCCVRAALEHFDPDRGIPLLQRSINGKRRVLFHFL